MTSRFTKKGRFDRRSKFGKENYFLEIFIKNFYKFIFWIIKSILKMMWSLIKLFFNLITLGKFKKKQ